MIKNALQTMKQRKLRASGLVWLVILSSSPVRSAKRSKRSMPRASKRLTGGPGFGSQLAAEGLRWLRTSAVQVGKFFCCGARVLLRRRWCVHRHLVGALQVSGFQIHSRLYCESSARPVRDGLSFSMSSELRPQVYVTGKR